MNAAIVSLCKALGQILDAHYLTFDQETSALLVALTDYIKKHGASK